MVTKVFPCAGGFGRRPDPDRALHNHKRTVMSTATASSNERNNIAGRTPELDGAVHTHKRAVTSTACPKKRKSIARRTPGLELDRAFHNDERTVMSTACPKDRNSIADHPQLIANKAYMNPGQRSRSLLPPSNRYSLWKFEQKYRTFVAAIDNHAAGTLFDDLYHDQVIHMMDGVPMNKAAMRNLYEEMFKQGTRWNVVEFEAIDSNHVQSVIRTKNNCMDFYGRSMITLEDGRIIRVGKIESALSENAAPK